MRHLLSTAGAVLASLLVSSNLYAAILWADLTGTTVGAATSTVAGFLGAVPITITGNFALNSLLTGAPGEPNYFTNNVATYSSSVVTNIPPTADLVKMHNAGVVTITFAAPVVDPVIAIVSMGGLAAVQWDFGTQPLTILSTGPGSFGTGTPLSKIGTSVLSGKESNGVVQFPGTMTTLSFTVVTAENWGGFTVGIPTATAPPAPVPLGPIPLTLTWEAPQVVKNLDGSTLEVTGYTLYRGAGAQCGNPALLPALNVTVPATALTYVDTVPAVLGDVCYELTSVAISGESERSTRAVASIGRSTAFPPRNLRLRF